mgnify:CR=1 FL=1
MQIVDDAKPLGHLSHLHRELSRHDACNWLDEIAARVDDYDFGGALERVRRLGVGGAPDAV